MIRLESTRCVDIRGTRRSVWRCIYKDEATGKYYIRMFNNFFEVVCGYFEEATGGWCTKDEIDMR